MLPVILYAISVIICFFVCRQFVEEAVDSLYDLVMLIIFILLPFANIIFTIMFFLEYSYPNKNEYTNIIRKIFFIKGGKKNDKTKGERHS